MWELLGAAIFALNICLGVLAAMEGSKSAMIHFGVAAFMLFTALMTGG